MDWGVCVLEKSIDCGLELRWMCSHSFNLFMSSETTIRIWATLWAPTTQTRRRRSHKEEKPYRIFPINWFDLRRLALGFRLTVHQHTARSPTLSRANWWNCFKMLKCSGKKSLNKLVRIQYFKATAQQHVRLLLVIYEEMNFPIK